MGSLYAKPSVVVSTQKPKTTTIKHTTKATTPTTPTAITTTPEPTTTPLHITSPSARITSEGLITHPSTNQIDSILLPVAIAMSTAFLVVAFILLLFVLRRRPQSDKPVGNNGSTEHVPAQVFSSVESSMDCSLNHVYVEHDIDPIQRDRMYTYVTKPSTIGGLPKGYAPSVISSNKVFRGPPDGKCRSAQAKGFDRVTNAFGDEDHYNLLFEHKPSVLNVLVMNNYENHPTNGCHQNYANVTEIPESDTKLLEAQPSNSEDTITSKGRSSSLEDDDLRNETLSAISQHQPCFRMIAPVNLDNPQIGYDPKVTTRKVMADDPEVTIGITDDVLYENAPIAGTVKSRKPGEPKYYVLERQMDVSNDITQDEHEIEENILY